MRIVLQLTLSKLSSNNAQHSAGRIRSAPIALLPMHRQIIMYMSARAICGQAIVLDDVDIDDTALQFRHAP